MNLITVTYNADTHQVVPRELDAYIADEIYANMPNVSKAWKAAIAAATQPETLSPWVDVKDELPALGERVFLLADGVVQNETYVLEKEDRDNGEFYWYRDDLEDCPSVKFDGTHKWMPLPKPEQGK